MLCSLLTFPIFCVDMDRQGDLLTGCAIFTAS